MKAAKAVVLKFNGKPLDFDAPTDGQARLLAALSKLPNDEVFSTVGVAERLGVSATAFRQHAVRSRLFTRYFIKSGKDLIWGSPSAIAEYQRQSVAHRGEM